MCFARPRKWAIYGFACTAASVVGAIGGWYIGHFAWAHLSHFFFHLPGFTPALFDKMSHLYQQYGFWVVMVKGLTPIPFKLVTISAGVCNVPLSGLILASIISRGARFFLEALAIRIWGAKAKIFLEKHLEPMLLLFLVLLVLGLFSVLLLKHH
jgi:membrane protein YqaA with SNARE-associated domain